MTRAPVIHVIDDDEAAKQLTNGYRQNQTTRRCCSPWRLQSSVQGYQLAAYSCPLSLDLA